MAIRFPEYPPAKTPEERRRREWAAALDKQRTERQRQEEWQRRQAQARQLVTKIGELREEQALEQECAARFEEVRRRF